MGIGLRNETPVAGMNFELRPSAFAVIRFGLKLAHKLIPTPRKETDCLTYS